MQDFTARRGRSGKSDRETSRRRYTPRSLRQHLPELSDRLSVKAASPAISGSRRRHRRQTPALTIRVRAIQTMRRPNSRLSSSIQEATLSRAARNNSSKTRQDSKQRGAVSSIRQRRRSINQSCPASVPSVHPHHRAGPAHRASSGTPGVTGIANESTFLTLLVTQLKNQDAPSVLPTVHSS